MSSRLIPAATLLLQLQAAQALGLDANRLRERLGNLPSSPEGRVPVSAYDEFWDAAQREYQGPGLPSALAAAIPFGAYGILDYLCGSAATVAGAVESLLLHFKLIVEDVRLEVAHEPDTVWITLRADDPFPAVAVEFTLAMLLGRLKYMGGEQLNVTVVTVPFAAGNARHSAETATSYVYQAPAAGIGLSKQSWALPLRLADPYLHRTLSELANKLALDHGGAGDLEQAIRARLRDALPDGDAKPRQLARLLGLSERTLQRRLSEVGRNYRAVVEDFRREEATRLLATARLPISKLAGRLGYADQTAFTRAFRQWTGTTPVAWRASIGMAD